MSLIIDNWDRRGPHYRNPVRDQTHNEDEVGTTPDVLADATNARPGRSGAIARISHAGEIARPALGGVAGLRGFESQPIVNSIANA